MRSERNQVQNMRGKKSKATETKIDIKYNPPWHLDLIGGKWSKRSAGVGMEGDGYGDGGLRGVNLRVSANGVFMITIPKVK